MKAMKAMKTVKAKAKAMKAMKAVKTMKSMKATKAMKSMKAMKVAEQAEKSVQAQPVADMDRPATRPAWAKIREEDENVEVAQLEEDRWICTFDVQPNDSVASTWAHLVIHVVLLVGLRA